MIDRRYNKTNLSTAEDRLAHKKEYIPEMLNIEQWLNIKYSGC